MAGVAPFNRDSGRFTGKRIVWGGRANLCSVLYMSTLAAIRHNFAIKSFYNRLIEAGKPKKVAITACMRKLLTILNAMVKNNTFGRKTSPLRFDKEGRAKKPLRGHLLLRFF